MTPLPCPTPRELVLLFDRELTESRADAVREHLDGCPACRRDLDQLRALAADVAAPLEPRPDALARLLARVDEAPEPARPRRSWRLAAALVAAAAIAGVVVAVPSLVSRRIDSVDFEPRGGPAEPSLHRDVGTILYRLTDRLERVGPDDAVPADAAYAVAARNLGAPGSAYVMVFAQDAARDLHWIEPAWTDPSADPAPPPLPHGDRDTPPSAASALDHPAPGPMRIFTLITPRPVHVSSVERLAGRALNADALRAAWPDAVVDEVVVRVQPGSNGGYPFGVSAGLRPDLRDGAAR